MLARARSSESSPVKMSGVALMDMNDRVSFMRQDLPSSHGSMITPPGILRDSAHAPPRAQNTDIPHILPHEKVFPIQIGQELFRLSGASLSSDAPSYFSEFFKCQLKTAEGNGDDGGNLRTLYIDRDPVTFKDISLHLQGYHITPRDGSHFVRLFADAQFYSLPRLISQLYEESIFISIGHRDFQIPREIFNDPGNSPNYFSLGFAVFFSSPTEVFPGLSRDGLLRPPSIMPPSVPNRSADTFSQLLHLLRGYPLHIRDEEHRAELLRDCRYYHLKGLEQKIIRHSISFNSSRGTKEISLRLEDIRQSGISIVSDPPSALGSNISYVNYARPYTDATSYELLVEIGDSSTRLHLPSTPNASPRAEFFGETKVRVSKLFDVIATKLNLPSGASLKTIHANNENQALGIPEDWIAVVLGDDCAISLDGKDHSYSSTISLDEAYPPGGSFSGFDDFAFNSEPSRKRRRGADGIIGIDDGLDMEGGRKEWIVGRGLWRLRISGQSDHGGSDMECVLVGVKIEAWSGDNGRNRTRGFLGD